jgi:hypothetical protein
MKIVDRNWQVIKREHDITILQTNRWNEILLKELYSKV